MPHKCAERTCVACLRQCFFEWIFSFFLVDAKVTGCNVGKNGIGNKAYRPNAHLLYFVMHYNGSII